MKNTVKNKAFDLSQNIVNLNKFLSSEKQEFIMSKQMLRSGTSVGANLSEADFAISKREFHNKLSIALKEANETLYWLRLLQETNYLTESQSKPLKIQCNEIISILLKSMRTTRNSLLIR